jgi:hypothetical protein
MARKYFSVPVPFKKSVYVLLLTGMVYILSSAFKNNNSINVHTATDSLLSKKAFMEVYSVLMSPRCMNCHPAGDIPFQGDESKLHQPNVKRGKDGKGMFANKCVNCHQDQNELGAPINPNWSMPPADMKMIFEGRSARELAAQILDPAANGNKTKEDLLHHVAEDTLVLVGWHPTKGNKMPPLTHEEFVKQFRLWIDNGAYLPD